MVNSPFSEWRNLQSEALYRHSWSCCCDRHSLSHQPVLSLCRSLDSFTARNVCVCVPPSELWGLAKEEARDLTQMHSLISLSLPLSVFFLFLNSSPSDMESEENYCSLNCEKSWFPHAHSLHSNIAAANQLAAGLKSSPGQAVWWTENQPSPQGSQLASVRVCQFWMCMYVCFGSKCWDWTTRVVFRDRGLGYQGSCWESFITVVFMNLGQEQKQSKDNSEYFKNVERK